jgi:valyl-tRNA synthetase
MDEAWRDQSALDQMQVIIDIVKSIRALRMQWGVKPSDKVNISVIPFDVPSQELLLDKTNANYIKALAKIDIFVVDQKASVISDAAITMLGAHKIMMPLQGLVDLAAEKKRLNADKLQKQKAIEALEARLNNQTFVSKAPIEVIEKEKQRLSQLVKEQHEICQLLGSLS